MKSHVQLVFLWFQIRVQVECSAILTDGEGFVSLLTLHCASVSVLSLTSCSALVLAAAGPFSLQNSSHQPHQEEALGLGPSSSVPQKPGSD